MLKEESCEYEFQNINKIINNVHDKVFRKIFDNKSETIKFINRSLKLKNKIKEEKIEKYNSSFITITLKNKESDIVYKLKEKNIFFLIEHQTKIDYSMPLRILEYENEIMRSAIDIKKINKKKYKMPLIIPIVLYTGKQKWNAKTYLMETQERLDGFDGIEFGKYNLIDINVYNKDELLKEETILSKLMLIEKSKNIDELLIYLDNVIKEIENKRNIYTDKQIEVLINLIDLMLRKKIGNKMAEKLIKKLKGEETKMLAVLEMIEKDNKRIREEGIKEGEKKYKSMLINIIYPMM